MTCPLERPPLPRPMVALFTILISATLAIPFAATAATLVVTSTADSGAGTLRQAVLDANAAAGDDMITFAIPGAGPHTISLGSQIDVFGNGAVSIDGYTQPGASPNTLSTGNDAVILIALNGPSSGGFAALTFYGGGSVRGLAIGGGFFAAITASGNSALQIRGNFIGLTPAGQSNGNAPAGIYLSQSASNKTIGGTSSADRNVISANSLGVYLGEPTSQNNVIAGNYIGTNPAGTAAIGNSTAGVFLNSAGPNTIGGSGSAGNLISGNDGDSSAGIHIAGNSSGAQILGNRIGLNASGTAPLPNRRGIVFGHSSPGGPSGITIGSSIAPNTIAYNIEAGISVMDADATGVSVGENSIFSNNGLGIDLAGDGVTLNDEGDGDGGPNERQNFPLLSAVSVFNPTTISVTGALSSAPSSSYLVRFFQSPSCDPSGYGEGKTYLASAVVNTDSGGTSPFLAFMGGSRSGGITATATDDAGNTSEFSPCLRFPSSSDFNADGKPDLVWRNYATGAVNVWFLDGTTYTGGATLFTVADPNWRIEGTGDFNADGSADLIWRHYASGAVNVWFMNGTAFLGGANLFTVSDLNWKIQAVDDFNGDGKPDLIWRNYATGAVNAWFLDGTSYLGGANLFTVADANWRIEVAGDFNADGKNDLIWRNYASGAVNVWYLDGTAYLGGASLFTVPGANWDIEAVGDYNGDGKLDLIWRNYGTGAVNVWFLDGTSYLGGANLFNVADPDWEIAGPR